MTREQLVEIAKRNIAHHRAGTQDQAPGVFAVPSINYYDPDRFRLEQESIFKRLPLVMAASVEIPDPGSYKALDAGDVPVLITRDNDGVARAFMNMCSHRGAIVVENGSGSARRFTCPYHAWSYDISGDLVGVMDRDDFGDLDPTCHGLTPLPVAERAGLVWATVTPGVEMDIDTFLQGYDEVLEIMHLDETTPVGVQSIPGPNWKVAYDGYLDFYHLPILHRDSFGPDFSNKACYSAWGPHQSVASPDDRAAVYEDLPAEDWPDSALHGSVVTIFPHVSIAAFDTGGKLFMMSQLFPGADPDTSITVQTFLAVGEVSDERVEMIEKMMAFLDHVVRDEDYYTGNGIQTAVKTQNRQDFLFGRNETGGQRFHSWVEALVNTADDDVADLFDKGVPLPD